MDHEPDLLRRQGFLNLKLPLKTEKLATKSVQHPGHLCRFHKTVSVPEVPGSRFVGTTRLFSGVLEIRQDSLHGKPNAVFSTTKSHRPEPPSELPDVLKPILGFPSRLFWVPRVAPGVWKSGDGNCDENPLKVDLGRSLEDFPENL